MCLWNIMPPPMSLGQAHEAVDVDVIWNRLRQRIYILNMKSEPCIDQMLQARFKLANSSTDRHTYKPKTVSSDLVKG